MILILASAIALGVALLAPRWLDGDFTTRMETWEALLRRRGPLAVALISVVVVWFTWDALVPTPRVHDESSYLLQSDIFASLRWTAPSPPLPEFFEQPHVQVVPRLASKYPPGHALLLAPGAAVGFHALMPLVLTGLTAALLFALAARLTDTWTALLTWLAWITAPIVLRYQPSYFSELTTTLLVLVSWWLLLDWRESRARAPLLWMALAIGWGAITRPLTMLAFAIPIGVVVLRDTVRLRAWRDFGLAFAIGVAVLGMLPLWSWRTTGDWRLSPVEKYRVDYLPFDKLGFTPDLTPPRREGSTITKGLYNDFLRAKTQQSLAALPRTAADRALHLTIAFFQKARLPLIVFAVIGLFAASGAARALRFGVASCAVLFIAHLPYSYWAGWTLYFLETAPVMSALIAMGVAWTARRLAGAGDYRAGKVLAAAAIVVFGIPGVLEWRIDHRVLAELNRSFKAQLATLPAQRAIVFVKYSPRTSLHVALVWNYADLSDARIWVVHDLGARNNELRRLAPDRASFDFDEDDILMERPAGPQAP